MPRRRAVAILAGAILTQSVPGASARPRAAARIADGCTPPPDGFQCRCPSVNGLYYIACCPTPDYICKCKPAPGGEADCVPCAQDRQCHNFYDDTWTCCTERQECIRGECKPYCRTETARGATRVYDPSTQCCTKHGIQEKYPVRNLEACRETLTPHPGYKATSNGCGPEDGPKFPDAYKKANFRNACDAHDICYGTCGSDEVKCNDRFCNALKRTCANAYPRKSSRNRRNCDEIANTYCDGVRILGYSAFEKAQSKACQCCP